ncbi:MAG: PilN domain-containing protein [Rhodoferax sp.]
MPQQINLCTPILLAQKRYFSAHTMAIALAVFLILGGTLFAAWVWNLDRASESFKQSLASHAQEIASLQSAIKSSMASAAPVDPALVAQLDALNISIAQREKLKIALGEGMFRPGWGHSDRLAWVARSIPAPVWITNVRMDGTHFEVSGFTLEPAALNEWVDKLAISPLMQGLKLATVRVENATAATIHPPGDAAPAAPAPTASSASAPTAPPRPVWSFTLVSAEPLAAISRAASAPGGKP